MKKILLLLALASFSLLSCDRSSDDLATTASQVAVSGNWRISLFMDSGNNETTDFNGYSFSFNSGGTLTVIKSGVTTNGTWSVSNSSNKFNIDLGPKNGTNKLGELTDDWKILSSSNTEIRLGDDNPASNEFLTFTKN